MFQKKGVGTTAPPPNLTQLLTIPPATQASEVALHQTLSRLCNLVQFVQFWHLFLDWNFKDCIEVQEKKKKVVVLCLRSPNRPFYSYGWKRG